MTDRSIQDLRQANTRHTRSQQEVNGNTKEARRLILRLRRHMEREREGQRGRHGMVAQGKSKTQVLLDGSDLVLQLTSVHPTMTRHQACAFRRSQY